MKRRTIIAVFAAILLVDLVAVVVAVVWIRPPRPWARAGWRGTPPGRPEMAPVPAREYPVPAATAAVIEGPHTGSYVPRRFEALGSCGPVPEGARLMLVVDSGRGVFSPKMPPLEVANGRWRGQVAEFGAPMGGQFSLCVFVVSEPAVEMFAAWQEQGRRTGSYPPFRGALPGGVEVARVTLRVGGN